MLFLRKLRHQIGISRRWYFRSSKPYLPLFVLTTYRSGSNLLVDYLNGIPGIRCYPELLNPQISVGPMRRHFSADYALAHLRRSLHSLKTPIRGCKLMFDQLAHSQLTVEMLRDIFPELKFVVLYRQSLAEQFVSWRAAHVTQQWVLKQQHLAKHVQVRIDPTELSHFCETTQDQYHRLLQCRWLRSCSVLMSYEEMVCDPSSVMASRVCPLVGLTICGTLSTKLLKQNTTPLRERITNYEEVASLLDSAACQQHYSWSA
jgi:LPS sulfotransferase NodH